MTDITLAHVKYNKKLIEQLGDFWAGYVKLDSLKFDWSLTHLILGFAGLARC